MAVSNQNIKPDIDSQVEAFSCTDNCFCKKPTPFKDVVTGFVICYRCGVVLDSTRVEKTPHLSNPEDLTNKLGIGSIFELGSSVDFSFTNFFRDYKRKPVKNQRLFRRLKKHNKIVRHFNVDQGESFLRYIMILNQLRYELKFTKSVFYQALFHLKKLLKLSKKDPTFEIPAYGRIILLASCLYQVSKIDKSAPLTMKQISEALQKSHHRIKARDIFRMSREIKPYYPALFVSGHEIEDFFPQIVFRVVKHPSIMELNLVNLEIMLLQEVQKILTKLPKSIKIGRKKKPMAFAIVYGALWTLLTREKIDISHAKLREAVGIPLTVFKYQFERLVRPHL